MPLPFGTGELAERVRNALDLRGRIPFALDEVVVPVARVLRADLAPFRTSGVTARQSSAAAAGVGVFPGYLLTNQTNRDQLLEQIVFHIRPNSATLTVVLGPMVSGFVPDTPGAASSLVTTEAVAAPLAGQLIRSVGIAVTPFTDAGPVATAVSPFLARVQVPTGQSNVFWDDLDIVIPRLSSLVMMADEGSETLQATFKCRYWDDTPG